MEIYPQLNFQPTSVYNWRKPLFSSYIWLSLLLLSIVMLSCFLFWRTRSDYVEPFWYPIWIFILLIALCMFISNQRKISKLNDVSLQNIADYIQKYTLRGFSKIPLYVFFFKNNKMGVLDVQSQRVVIPAEYDMLTWKTKDKILQAKIHGSAFLIDINNKKLS